MPAKWTVMVYMAGNNSLSGAAAVDLEEMRKVGSTDAVQALAFIKQRQGGARRIKVGKDGQNEVVQQLGDIDSGDPQTVREFIEWGVQTAPADRYALVFWNHGSGWSPDDLDQLYRRAGNGTGVDRRELNQRSTQSIARSLFSTTVQKVLRQPTALERAICSDDATGHSLDTLELGHVLTHASGQAGHAIDVLGMDACLMSTLEVAYECRADARVVVGSEELEPAAGWPYEEILTDLNATPDRTRAHSVGWW